MRSFLFLSIFLSILLFPTDCLGQCTVDESYTIAGIYPNPTTGSLILNGDHLYPLPYELFSLDGKCILRGELLHAEESIDISHLSSEMYHLKVGNKWIKVLKQ